MTDKYCEEYVELTEELDPNGDQRRAAWNYMDKESSHAGELKVRFSFLPRLLTAEDHSRLSQAVQMTHSILTKVIRAYLTDEGVRSIFHMDKRVEDLIMMYAPMADTASDAELLPFGRFDCFYDEASGNMRYVEFNTDCSSGLNKTYESYVADSMTTPYKAFCERHDTWADAATLFEGWVDDFLGLYGNTPDAKPNPNICIVVCHDGEEVPFRELERAGKLFEKKGAAYSICDVRKLGLVDGRLVCEDPFVGEAGVPIDVVWRYVITVDLLQYWDECSAFLEALRTGAVQLFGTFATQVAHDKQLYALLRQPELQAIMTDEERAFIESSIPFTAFLDDPALDIDAVKREPEKWVIKPTDWYDNIGVYVGPQFGVEEWSKIVDDCLAKKAGLDASAYIIQEFCKPQYVEVIPLYGNEEDFTAPPKSYGCLTGMFCFNGKFAGIFNRLSPYINVTEPGKTIYSPTLWVK